MAVTILIKESLLTMIENSVGSNMFRTLCADKDGQVVDILENGEVSCANFVSTLLHRFQLITLPHATVTGLIRRLELEQWLAVDAPEPGDVIIWEAIAQASDELHLHCGFYVGEGMAVSNDYRTGVPVRHHYTDELPGRGIVAVYRHPSFANP